jgi:hypothetical protein
MLAFAKKVPGGARGLGRGPVTQQLPTTESGRMPTGSLARELGTNFGLSPSRQHQLELHG